MGTRVFRMIHRAAPTYAGAVNRRSKLRVAAALAVSVTLVAACTTGSPRPPTTTGAPSLGTSSVAASPSTTTTAAEPPTFPLAVVTGITNLKANTTVKELTGLAERFPRLAKLWVDAAYQGPCATWIAETLGWTVEVVRKPSAWVWVGPGQEPPTRPAGFQVLLDEAERTAERRFDLEALAAP